MARRSIVHIDEEKCNGCGLCVPACAEGALQIIDGKARLIGEIMNVTAGMDKAKANELAKAIMIKVDERISQVSGPVPFHEKYDIQKVKPKAEYESGLLAVKEELASMGMPYH